MSKISDQKRLEVAQKLLDAAYDFWEDANSHGQYGAVQWLTGTNGELIIFTRSEYRESLMKNIERLSFVAPVNYYHAEEMPVEDDE